MTMKESGSVDEHTLEKSEEGEPSIQRDGVDRKIIENLDEKRQPVETTTTTTAATKRSTLRLSATTENRKKRNIRISWAGMEDDDTRDQTVDSGREPTFRSVLSDIEEGRVIIEEDDSVTSSSDCNDSEIRISSRKARQSAFGRSLTMTRAVSTRIRTSIERASTEAYTTLFGEEYTKREGTFVLLSGALIAFNSGFVNGTCISGLLFPTGEKQMVAGYAASYTESAFALLDGNYSKMEFHFGLIGFYAIGAFIAGLFSPDVTPYQIHPSYGPTFCIGGILLMMASILAAVGSVPASYVFYLATAANGIQNGIASIYSANLIRSSLTGTTTDASIILAQCLRGNPKHKYRGLVLIMINSMFWIGSVVSFFASQHFLSYTLLFNASLFWVVGLALVSFLVKELGITVQAALYGIWKWKRTLRDLSEKSIAAQVFNFDLVDWFDEIDKNGDQEIDPAELLGALQDNNIKIGVRGIKILMKAADENDDGVIDRMEWAKICEKMEDYIEHR